MSKQEKTITKNRRGRPATGLGILIGVRLQPDLLAWLDEERAKLDPAPSRPEMIRAILERAKG
ncbi:ribbon-helix-helix protein, CopG family [Cereibacter sphaeroides]|uniref:ribbon-helix-helix protein, CopG family n=1 Tax=Cereibacter sphaeroides TaxID=1063 RepID=UPI000E5BEAAE|nr:ribbon-helix-helix protein, CopG family [Cereibacter sphaeroides]RHZ91864.1 ribbon-helix-helix protein, CopG family [Cereibacter sphaeroides]